MTRTDIMMYGALIAQVLGAVVGVAGVVIMLKRRAKERREQINSKLGALPTLPAAPGPDRRDWHGAPAGKPQ
jgi:glycerol uptake facilitator-like aquaporin